ncbi:STAS domain-containing protein [Neobacillus notoginsengisoli]|uniref:STAS domain-containing protein n=1 Tax=Neobacillus notoginsengisoli TaxID=1578198 RepID=A0A417YSD7_9BACI|nr:STAS domain-containing protein [Neobacillus notoginsengisoli]RHW38901.1 STAS domain-containing protein [Neobacillus notoginsengisoli]
MRELDEALYQYLLSHSENMTEEWLSRRDSKAGSLYSSDASPELVRKLRDQNALFNEKITEVFIEDEETFKKGIIPWTRAVSEDRANSNVPLYYVLEQFGVFRSVIMHFIERFAREQHDSVGIECVFRWTNKINFAFEMVIDLFSRHFYEINNDIISEKEKIISELSSPVIPVTKGTGVLPLIGEIDLDRATAIMESVLTQSTAMRLSQLVIDLSGVPAMDTAVACQLSKLIKGLNLIGINATLSGIRPEVAQAAVALGITFDNTDFETDLAAALEKIHWQN